MRGGKGNGREEAGTEEKRLSLTLAVLRPITVPPGTVVATDQDLPWQQILSGPWLGGSSYL